jgi:hypothetical protein
MWPSPAESRVIDATDGSELSKETFGATGTTFVELTFIKLLA